MAEERWTYRSQMGQDRWVIEEVFRGKREGFFLDLAASDGLTFSNTYVLEKAYGWDGICIEANPFLYRQLRRTRACRLVNTCIDGVRHEVEFLVFGLEGGIIDDDTDNSPSPRRNRVARASSDGCVVTLQTALLEDVLEEAGAPDPIDYFSFDVEGAETRILRSFPFHKRRFMAMTIERPTPELNHLLSRNGYVFVRNSGFDSFYVHEALPSISQLTIEPFTQMPQLDPGCNPSGAVRGRTGS